MRSSFSGVFILRSFVFILVPVWSEGCTALPRAAEGEAQSAEAEEVDAASFLDGGFEFGPCYRNQRCEGNAHDAEEGDVDLVHWKGPLFLGRAAVICCCPLLGMGSDCFQCLAVAVVAAIDGILDVLEEDIETGNRHVANLMVHSHEHLRKDEVVAMYRLHHRVELVDVVGVEGAEVVITSGLVVDFLNYHFEGHGLVLGWVRALRDRPAELQD